MTKESKGFAFVTYVRPEDALASFRALDKKPFQGRLLHIIGAVDRNSTTAEREDKSKSLKEQRNEKRRAAAGKGFNWGMLYMNVRRQHGSQCCYLTALLTERRRPILRGGPVAYIEI